MDAFWEWWRFLPLRIDPVILQFGSFRLQYYGLMYVLAFLTIHGLVIYYIRREPDSGLSEDQAGTLSALMMAGLLIGARLGYVLFYNLTYYFEHPLEIFLPVRWQNGLVFTGISGMSYHGGLIGIILFAGIYIRKNRLPFLQVSDLYVSAIPIGYTFGRIGNFINGELYGRITESSIGMIFPMARDDLPRHPSQLYEAFFEGIFLFLVLWRLKRIGLRPGAMLGFYLIGYGTVRFFIEFFREPDSHLGFVFLSFSMGQILCGTMVIAGLGWLYFLRRKNQ